MPAACQEGAVGRVPCSSMNRRTAASASEDAQLVPQDQDLQPKVGVRVTSIDQGLEE